MNGLNWFAADVPRRPTQVSPLSRFPLLITGIAGVVGYNALPYFRQRYPGRVVGVRQEDNWRLIGEDIVVCNAEDYDGLRRLFDRFQFRAVLDCAGNCALRACEQNPELARRVNVDGVDNLLRVLEGTDVRLVHLSVDLVYSGTRDGWHVEDDPTDPVTVYGQTMVEAERLIFERRPTTCVLRISLPMGISFSGHAGAIDWIQSRFRNHRPATLYLDEFRTPTYTDCLNVLCEHVLASDLAGLYHAGAPRRLSLYQIGQIINRVGGYDPRLLQGIPRIEAGPMPPRAGDVSMNSGKLARDLGFHAADPWPFDEALVPTDRDWHFERPADEPGSLEYLARVLYRNPLRPSADVTRTDL